MATKTEDKQGTKAAGYLVLKEVSVRDVNEEPSVHLVGAVLSGWEVENNVREKIEEGSARYRAIFEPLTEDEVHEHRSKATALEGDRKVGTQSVSPPWDDYVGLHPEEIISRLHDSSDRDLVERVKLYEGAGLNRPTIRDYVAPVERQPWSGYDDLDVRDVLKKLDVLSDEHVQEVLSYESSHRKRPAILTYEKDTTDDTKGDS